MKLTPDVEIRVRLWLDNPREAEEAIKAISSKVEDVLDDVTFIRPDVIKEYEIKSRTKE